ncbi:hypothetical protein ACFWWC_28955 [Streptomyces sp. NPDC058642]|uniref:hypothetical protein n=1 Tax=Streptomyces sp. NPDC058642 TaxID=3346572 RepID=UPI00364C3F41
MQLELAGRHPLLRHDLALHPEAPGRLVLNARRLLFASPLDLAASAAAAHIHAHAGRDITLLLPDAPDVASYLQRMDLPKALPSGSYIDGDHPAGTRYDRSDILLEVTSLTPGTADAIGERLARVAISHLGSRDGRRVFRGLGELIDNAISHGASTCGAFIAAQAYTGKTTGHRRLEIAVCDTGVGVLAHLRRNRAHSHITTSAHALRHALEPGVSGTDEHRGNGLPDLLAGTRNAATRLVLRSGDGFLRASRVHRTEVALPARTTTPVQGTWSWLRVSYRP